MKMKVVKNKLTIRNRVSKYSVLKSDKKSNTYTPENPLCFFAGAAID